MTKPNKMNNPFDFNSFMPEARSRRWVEHQRQRYQNPEKFKEYLKQQSDEHWKQAQTGGVSEEMSILKAQRKREVAEKKRLDEERRQRELEKKRLKELSPNFPKVWDLNYVREEPQKIFMRKKDDSLDWDFLKFKIYVDESNYFTTNFYEDLEGLKWKNTEKVNDIRKSKFNINENFFNAIASMYVLTWKSGFSLENVNYSKNSKILQSLGKFQLYFWFKRFQGQPDLLRRHLEPSDYKFLMNKIKTYHPYKGEFDHTRQIWGYEIRDLNKKYGHEWKNVRDPTSKYGGQIGYEYQVINHAKTLPINSGRQFYRFIRPKSNGLNSLGQTFLVESIKAFIYCVLGA